MVDWVAGMADASVSERDSSFVLVRVPGSPDVLKEAAISGFVTKDASGNVGIGTSSPDVFGRFYTRSVGLNSSGTTMLQINGTTYGGIDLGFNGTRAATLLVETAGLYLQTLTAAPIVLGTNGTERMRIDRSGNFLLGTTSAFITDDYGFSFVVDGSGQLNISHATGSGTGFGFALFGYAGVSIGSISQSGTTGVSYNTSSDYRLKSQIEDLTDSGAFIDALRPRKGIWNSDGSPFVGFIAHEFSEVSPSSVSGEKDAMQEHTVVDDVTGEETTTTVPAYQSMQASSPEVMANIIAELQSLRARVAALENGGQGLGA